MYTALFVAASAAVVSAQALNKPALTDNLDYLLQGNADNLASSTGSYSQWDPSTIPEDCKYETEQNSLNAADIETYNVTYSDCGDPYVICRHKSSPIDLNTLLFNYGKVPVHMRDFNKHIIALPNGGGAYNRGGNIVFFDTTPDNVDVMLHETGHSLDGQGAMSGFESGGYSGGQPFNDAYNADSNVPDNYAQTNIVEDFAQNVVVAVYDTVVPGGFPGVQSNWGAIQNQYNAVKRDDNDNIVPGGTCNRRLAPSNPVPVNGGSKKRTAVASGEKKDWEEFFTGKYDLKKPNREHSTVESCNFH